MSDRTKRRILSIAKETAQYVPLERRSAKAALKKMATVHVSTLRINNAHTSFLTLSRVYVRTALKDGGFGEARKGLRRLRCLISS